MAVAQWSEHYPDTVKVDGSIPSVTTELVRSSIGPEYPAFTRRVVSSSLTEPTNWMNSSMANGRIAPMVERRLEAPKAQVRILFRPQTGLM
jgi:hypothetical protein